MSSLTVSAIPAFSDNYIWLIRNGGNLCAVVDPGDARPVFDALKRAGLDLCYILLTHHHPDHIGGMQELQRSTGAQVFGPDDTRIKGEMVAVREGDVVNLPKLDLTFTVAEVPGHTSSHIVFTGHDCLFCGDTLFSVGCGRLFEGTPEQMQDSLDKLAALPQSTRIYCGHEYTLANCEFALDVEPGNAELQAKWNEVKRLRALGEVTLPGVLGEELRINPFLRSREKTVVAAARKRDPMTVPGAATLRVIRLWKDGWQAKKS